MSRPDGAGMYRCQGSGILSPGGADEALICGTTPPGQESKVKNRTGRGDRPCLSITGMDTIGTQEIRDTVDKPPEQAANSLSTA